MNLRHHRKHGYTLAELLVSIAIIAMITGMAIPAFVKFGGFASNKKDVAARELYGVLRAARISSISYRNDTAVVYIVRPRADNYSGAQAFVVDGFGMATRATKDQYERVIANAAYDHLLPDEVFVLAKDPQAKFRDMPNNTAVVSHLTAEESQILRVNNILDLPPASLADFKGPVGTEGLSERGMRMIYLFQVPDNSDDALEPLDTFPNTSMDNTLANAYPAHVFNPTGELGVPGSSLQPWKERITIAVGSSPDAPKDERFANNPEETGATTPVLATPVLIEVYRSTGRVQIAS